MKRRAIVIVTVALLVLLAIFPPWVANFEVIVTGSIFEKGEIASMPLARFGHHSWYLSDAALQLRTSSTTWLAEARVDYAMLMTEYALVLSLGASGLSLCARTDRRTPRS